MKKHVQCLLLLAALLMPWVVQGQSFTSDFESATDRAAWTLANSATNVWAIGTATSNGGSYALYISNDNGTSNAYTISSTANVFAYRTITIDTAGDFVYSYDWKANGESCCDYMRVAIMPNSYTPTAGTSTGWANATGTAVSNAVADMSNNQRLNVSSSWSTVTGTVSLAVGTYKLVFFWHNDGSVGTNPPGAIDNVVFTRLTCPMVQNLTALNLDTTSFDIVWQDVAGASEWLVRLGVNGTPVSVTDTTYAFTGMTPNTTYNVQVAPICSGNDTGMWRTITVKTPCNYLLDTDLPYTMTFEGIPTGSNVPFVDCWTRLNNGTSYGYYPYASSSTTYNHTPGGTVGLYWYNTTTTGTYGDYQYVVLPGLDATIAVNTLMLNFWAKSSSTTYHPVLEVGVMTNPNDINTFEHVTTINVANTTAWDLYEANLSSYTGTGSYVAVRALRSTASWYVYVDDVSLQVAPSCEHPTNLTAHGVTHEEFTATWTGDANAGSYLVRLDTVGGTYDVQEVYDTTVTFSMLDPGRAYTLYVSSICTGGDTTMDVSIAVTTQCAPLDSLPVSFDFEDAVATSSNTDPRFAPCLTRLNNGTTYFGYPYVGTSTYNHTPGGSKGLYWYNNTTTGTYGDYQYVVLPAVDENIYSISALEVLFWAKASSTSYSPVFEVGVMDDPYDVSTFTHVSTINVGNSTQWAEYSAAFASYTGTGRHIAIRALRNTASWYAYFDDITLREAPACPDILTIEATTVATTGARLEWTVRPGLAGTAEEFELEIIPDDPNESTTSLTSTEPRLLVSGLTPGSTYHVIIRSNCMADGYSPWSDTLDFTTTTLGCEVPDPTQTATLTFNQGTAGTDYYMPVNNFYNYTYTQQLILASELNGPTTISGIEFQYGYTSAVTDKTNCTIYLANVSVSDLSSGFVPYNASTFQMVYTGNLNGQTSNSGWTSFTFTNNFQYDGTSNLLIVVHDNSGSYMGSSYVFNHHSTSGVMGRYINNDSSPYDLSSVSGGTSVSYRTNMKLHTFGCLQYATCGAPTVFLDSATATDVYISWLPGNDETSWEVSYRIGNGTWVSDGTETNTSHTFTNLTPATNYEFRVSTDCGTEYRSNSITLTTPCLPIDVPFYENFETFSTTVADPLPVCWEKHTNYTSNYPYASTSYNHSSMASGRSMYMYSTSSTYSYMVLPEFNLPIDSTVVSFYLYKPNTSYTHAIQVGVMTDPEDPATFELVGTATPTQLSIWEGFEVSLANYTGTGRRIAIMSPNGVYSYPYLDDLAVERLSDCRRVGNVVTANVTANSVDLTWGSTGADEYEVSWVPAGIQPNLGYITNGILDTTYALTGLTSSSDLDIYVRGICSGDTGAWSFSRRISTLCGTITLPFTENFESRATTSSSSSNSNFINCWHHLNNGTSSMGYPYIGSSSSYNHTTNGTKGLYWYGSTTTGTYGDYYYIVLPPLDTLTNPANSVRVKFWAKASGTSYHPIVRVGVMTDPTDVTTFQPVNANVAINPGSSTAWSEFTVDFSSFTGSGDYIAIGALRPSSLWYMYMDDITVEAIPDCPDVTNFTATNITPSGATLDWTENGTASYWEIEYGPQGFIRGNGTTEYVYSLPHTITGLTPNTEYTVYVTPECSGTAPVDMFGFRTECGALTTLPYTYGFEGLNTGSSDQHPFIPCWHHLNNGTSYFGYPYITSTYHTGSRSLYWYMTTTTGTYGDYAIVVLPAVDTNIYPIRDLQLKFWGRSSSTSYYPVFQVGVMTDPNDATTFSQMGVVNVGNSTQWEEYTVGLGNYTGNGEYVALRATRTGSSWYAYTDDFTLEQAPLCPPITNISVNQVGTTGALVSWTPQAGIAGVPTNYEIEVTPTTPGSTALSFTSTENRLFITGLTHSTGYSMVVRAFCDADGYGTWSSPVTFTTVGPACLVPDLTTSVTREFSNGTTQTNGIFVNSSWGNTFCQAIYTAEELRAAGVSAGRIKGVRLGYSSGGSYSKEFSIYMGNTTLSSFSSASSMVLPTTMTLCYGPTVRSTSGTSGWIDYTFTTPFVWDGTSNIILSTFMNQSGSSQSSSGFYGYSTNSGRTGASVYRYMDSNPFTASSCTSQGSAGSTSTYLPSISFVTDGCAQYGTCAAPLVVVDSTSESSISVSWAAGADESSWDVEYRQGTSGSWTYESNESTMSYTFTGLNANTTYQVRITANCSDTDMASIITVKTPCGAITLPYTQTFEGLPTGSNAEFPSCMYRLNNGTTYGYYPYVSNSTTYNHTPGGSQGLYWYNTTTTGTYGDYQIVVMPRVDGTVNPANTLQMTFWAKPSSTSYAPVFEVGVLTDPEDVTTFQSVGTVNIDNTNTNFHPYEVVLSSYTGNGEYIALRANRPSSSWYAYVDDITIEYAPACPRITNVHADNITQNSATIAWTSNNDALEYEVQYGPAGFNMGSGTIVSGIMDDSVAITGLTTNTPYDVYVRGICSDDTANWSFQYQFRTACGMIDSMPFFEDFENQVTGSSSTGSPFIPCWGRLNNGTSYSGYPYVSNSSSYNHTAGGGQGLYWYATTTTGTYGDYYYIILPPVDTLALPLNTLQLSFWVRSSSTSYNPVFQVGVMEDPTDTTFELLQTINVNGNTTWTEHIVPLNSYTGYGQYVAIRAFRPSSTWYAYMDDIGLDLIPLCPRVENLHATVVTLDTITIAWEDTSSNSAWYVEYDTVPFAPGTGLVTAIMVTDTFYTMTGLDSGTTYHIYVYPDCNGDVYYRHAEVRTLAAGPAYPPYFCDFAGESGAAWDLVNGNQANKWCVGEATFVGTADSSSLYISNDNGLSHTYNMSSQSITYAYRTFRLSAGEYGLSFDWHCAGEGEEDDYAYDFLRPFVAPASLQLQAGIAPDGYTTESYTFAETPLPTGCIELRDFQWVYAWVNHASWTHYSGTFTVPTDGVYKLVFAWGDDASGGTNPPAAVDNITLVQNICPQIDNLAVNDVRCDSATISWNTSEDHTDFFVEYDTVLFTPGNAANSFVTTDSTVILSGLDTGMTYFVYVSSICNGDTGMAVGTRFTTLAGLPTTVPYFCNFEGSGNNGWDLINGTEVNYWMVGTATSNSPTHSLYITNNGSVNEYDGNSESYSYAVRAFNLTDTGEYAYSFDWKCYGESNYDFIRAFIVPASVNIEAGVLPFGSGAYDFGQTIASSPWVDITGRTSTPYGLNQQSSTWQTRAGTTRINTPGIYKLVFVWANDGSVMNNPAGAIDNVALQRNSCPSVQNVSAAVTADSIALTWTAGGSEMEWEVTIDTTSVIVYSSNYTFTGLLPNTDYNIMIRAVCGAGDSSMYYSETYHTPCTAVAVPYSENFDALTTGTATSNLTVMPPCWEYTLTNTSYSSASYYPGVYYSSSYAHSGNYSLRLYGVGYFCLPPMSVPLDSLQLTFWNYITSTSYGLEVGVMEGNTFVPIQDVTLTSSSTHVQTTVYFGSYTGNSRIIAFRNYYTTSTTTGYSYNYIDNVVVDYMPTCPPVVGIISTGASTSTIDVDWTEQGSATEWQIEYGPVGHTLGSATATRVIVTAHPYTITGLDTLTNYDIYVRPICSATDTGTWAGPTTLMTAMCENAFIAQSWPAGATATTSSYGPIGYSTYNYSYVQTLLDSAQFAGLTGEISAFEFLPSTSSTGNYFTNISVYMANVPETSLSGAIIPDTTNHRFVEVIHNRNFNYTTATWQLHAFDTNFVWDGHSNVLVAVKRDHGSWSSGASFRAHTTSNTRTYYYYQDSGPISITSPSATSSGSGSYAGDMRFYACDNVATCQAPVITSTTGTYQSATMTWSGNGTDYEVAIKPVSATDWGVEIPVTATTYTFTGLQPATPYQLRVRQDCTADSLGYSDWAMTTFVTDSLPCLAPDTFGVIGTTNATATFAWLPVGNETAWEIFVWNSTWDSLYSVTSIPATVSGFTAGVTYYATIRALCGDASNIEGEWGDTVQFTAATCESVTGLTSSDVTFNSVTLSWTAVTGAVGYRVVCTDGQDYDTVTVTTNTHTFTGLYDET
ncbi:MAG: fibronectin type III domain-containing protein, partial [Bacteroidales bacterium]|nr:fibronectin type III domain-containing protein [Bacteroidales bacterium]